MKTTWWPSAPDPHWKRMRRRDMLFVLETFGRIIRFHEIVRAAKQLQQTVLRANQEGTAQL